MAFILASASPRRTQLLTRLGIDHQVLSLDIPEIRQAEETALGYGYRISLEKARAVQTAYPDKSRDWILAADTEVIVSGDEVLGKPENYEHFLSMMAQLSGQPHWVQTVIALCRGEEAWQNHQLSQVVFRSFNQAELADYWASGEPLGKAGGYAIKGRAEAWISGFQGSYSGVMGLPLYECEQLLKLAGAIS
jgi:septum formation protein